MTNNSCSFLKYKKIPCVSLKIELKKRKRKAYLNKNIIKKNYPLQQIHDIFFFLLLKILLKILSVVSFKL